MVISIRKATQRDIPHLVEVQAASTQNFRTSVDFRTWLRWRSRVSTPREQMDRAFRLGHLWVAVAELETGEEWIVGFANGVEVDDWNRENHRRNVFLILIYTHVSARRMGVGSRLLERIEQDDVVWEQGLDYLVATAFMEHPWNEPEEGFLEKNGFQRMNVLGWHRSCPVPRSLELLQHYNTRHSAIQPGMQRAL